jgi:hypothetical protein
MIPWKMETICIKSLIKYLINEFHSFLIKPVSLVKASIIPERAALALTSKRHGSEMMSGVALFLVRDTGVRPWAIVSFFDEIAKMIPLDFAQGDGATQLYFPIADADNFPVAATGTMLDVDFLSDMKRIRSEDRNCFCIHVLDPSHSNGTQTPPDLGAMR